MSRKQSPEARVMDFFETTDELVAKTVFNLVQATMKRRFPKAEAPKAARKPRKVKAGTTAGSGSPDAATQTSAAA